MCPILERARGRAHDHFVDVDAVGLRDGEEHRSGNRGWLQGDFAEAFQGVLRRRIGDIGAQFGLDHAGADGGDADILGLLFSGPE